MADRFHDLSSGDQRDALEVASGASGRPIHLLEKDVWVVWALETLFTSPHGPHLVFKGGTSLSKAYGAIRRFSEDVDLTYDIRAIAPDLVADSADALPLTRSQEKRWTKEIRARLAEWVESVALPSVVSALRVAKLSARAYSKEGNLYIEYDPLASGTGYVRPTVMLEFGARATGEPWLTLPVVADAAAHLPTLIFPQAQPQVMKAERTFWEKATAIHVFCLQGRFRGADRFARHWHDIARLGEAGFAIRAIDDADLADRVAQHKVMFFPEKDVAGEAVDYAAAVSGALHLVPDGAALEALAEDYRRMVDDGLLLDDAEPFVELVGKCRRIEEMANAARRGPAARAASRDAGALDV